MKNTILIVDDDQRNIFALSAVLKAKGFKAGSASSVVAAFGVLDSDDSIALILLDMMMPGMDGYEVIPKIKADPEFSTLPIIAVTAQAMPGDRERCLAAGASGYVPKPVEVDALVALLHKHLQ